jgi:hypothetical protein
MTELFERLERANPTRDDDYTGSFEAVWQVVSQPGPAASPGPASRERVGRRAAVTRRRALVTVAVVAAAGVAFGIGLSATGPQSAFAGWTADPTQPAAGQLQAAKSACATDRSLASLTPTLIDARGPFSAFLYLRASGPTICVVGPGLTPNAGPGRTKNKALILNTRFPRTAIAPDTISAPGVMLVFPTPTAEFGMAIGQVGRGVTAVTLTLDNGSKVKATTERGWFAAWWPNSQHVKSADLTTTTGSTTQPLNVPTSCIHPRPGRTHPLNPPTC